MSSSKEPMNYIIPGTLQGEALLLSCHFCIPTPARFLILHASDLCVLLQSQEYFEVQAHTQKKSS